jgi:hypothetical protein
MATNERVDITGPTADAWAAAARWASSDPAAAENMAVLAELGELLDSGRTDPELEEECRELLARSIRLCELSDKHWEQQWALAWARRGNCG